MTLKDLQFTVYFLMGKKIKFKIFCCLTAKFFFINLSAAIYQFRNFYLQNCAVFNRGNLSQNLLLYIFRDGHNFKSQSDELLSQLHTVYYCSDQIHNLFNSFIVPFRNLPDPGIYEKIIAIVASTKNKKIQNVQLQGVIMYS